MSRSRQHRSGCGSIKGGVKEVKGKDVEEEERRHETTFFK